MKRNWDFWGDDWKSSDMKVLKRGGKRSDQGEYYERLVRVKLPPYLRTLEDKQRFVEGAFYYRCGCSHDCCGHMIVNAWSYSMKRVKGREYTLTVSYGYNV